MTGSSDRERLERLESLFFEGLNLPPLERRAFIDRATAGDPDLRLELEGLFASDDQALPDLLGDYLDSGAALAADSPIRASVPSFVQREAQPREPSSIPLDLTGGSAESPRTGQIAMELKPPFPPFNAESAAKKVRQAENAWNARDPFKVSSVHTRESLWRDRLEFFRGRDEIRLFLTRKWNRELDYRQINELWAFEGNRISLRFAYEWRSDSHQWYRSYGTEHLEFADQGLARVRFASVNDLPIQERDRKFDWPLGRRPADHPGLSELGL